MYGRYCTSPFVTDPDEPEPEHTSENGPASPSSGDDSKLATGPSPKKRRSEVEKRVVSVPIGDVEGSKSKGETYAPSDSWAWRKYGQKPIKGSPYPRGYYRCSSSKGCPARKQVERSRVDPTTIVITYSCDHNHPLPTTKSHHSSPSSAVTTTTTTTSSSPGGNATSSSTSSTDPTTTIDISLPSGNFQADELVEAYASQSDLKLVEDSLLEQIPRSFGWFGDVAYDFVLDNQICAGSSSFDDDDVAVVLSMREEDESLFADLEELPECSEVFRRRLVEPNKRNRQCGSTSSLGPVPCCASTG